jgi:hypothetical protein
MKKIAVITPYYNEDLDLIKKANESVLNQNNKDKYPKNIKVNSQMNKNAYEYFSDKSNQETFNQLFGFTWKVNS